jgi:hypothetical protein
MTIGMSPLAAAARPTGIGAFAPNRPPWRDEELELLWVVMYQPEAATTARPNPIPSRVLNRFIYKSAPKAR